MNEIGRHFIASMSMFHTLNDTFNELLLQRL